MTEWKGKKKKKGRQKDREVRARAGMRTRCSAGGLAARRARFSNLAPGSMSLFVQPQYQTFPFPAQRSPLWRTALLGSSFPLVGLLPFADLKEKNWKGHKNVLYKAIFQRHVRGGWNSSKRFISWLRYFFPLSSECSTEQRCHMNAAGVRGS